MPSGSGPDGGPLVQRSLPTHPGVRASASLYLAEADGQGFAASRRMLDVGTERCPAHVAAGLGTRGGERVFVRRKLMLADDVPVRIATSYFPLSLAEGSSLAAPDFVPGGLQEALEGMGHRFGHADETLTARMPSPYEAEALHLASSVPVVQVLRSSYDTADRPVHTLETVCAADRHTFRIQQSAAADVF